MGNSAIPSERGAPDLRRWLSGTVFVLAASSPWVWLAGRWRGIGGVDFLLLILNARGTFTEFATSDARFTYFPGVYPIYGALYRLFGPSLPAFQLFMFGVVLGAGLLTALIVRLATDRSIVAVGVLGLFPLCIGLLEGDAATTELLVATPLLAALVAWLVWTPRGRVALATAAIGLGGGTSVLLKQQGALIVTGVVLGVVVFGSRAPVRSRVRHLGVVAACGLVTFATGMVVAGGGVGALEQGLDFARTYPARGGWSDNLTNFIEAAPIVALLAVCALALGLSGGVLFEDDVKRQIFIGSLLAAAFSMVQFRQRWYLHYGLLAVPFVLIAFGLALSAALDPGAPQGRSTATRRAAVAVTALLPVLALVPPDKWTTLSFRPDRTTPFTTEFADTTDFDTEVCTHIRRGEEVVVVPSRANIFHFRCETQSTRRPLGYLYVIELEPYSDAVVSVCTARPAYVSLMLNEVDDALAVQVADFLEPAFRVAFESESLVLYELDDLEHLPEACNQG